MNATTQSNSHCGIQIRVDDVCEACGIHGTNEKCIQSLAMKPERKFPGRPRCRGEDNTTCYQTDLNANCMF